MLIYIEGVDGSGKTTLRDAIHKRLKERLDLKVEITDVLRIGTHPTSESRMEEFALLLKIVELCTSDTVYVCDRGPISDIIYRAFDKYNPVTTYDEVVRLRGVIPYNLLSIVLCDTDKSEELMRTRGDDNPIAHTYHQTLRYLFKQLCAPLYPDIYDLSVTSIAKFLDELLMRWEVRH